MILKESGAFTYPAIIIFYLFRNEGEGKIKAGHILLLRHLGLEDALKLRSLDPDVGLLLRSIRYGAPLMVSRGD